MSKWTLKCESHGLNKRLCELDPGDVFKSVDRVYILFSKVDEPGLLCFSISAGKRKYLHRETPVSYFPSAEVVVLIP